jgi:hypothetical protein
VGVAKSFTLGSFADANDPGPWQVTVDWGDSSTDTVFNATAVGALPSQSHTYAAGTFDVLVTVSDGDLGASASFQVVVSPDAPANVAPTLTPPANQTATAGASKSFALGSFADANDPGPWQVTVDWGDNSADSIFNATAAGNLFDQSHTYAAAGDYEVLVTVSDGALAANAAFQVTVNPGSADMGAVMGLIFADANGNGQQEAGEPGIPGVQVTLTDEATAAGATLELTTTTDSDGGYLFDNVPPGDYTLLVEPPPGYTFAGPSQQSVTVNDSGSITYAPSFSLRPTTDGSGDTLYLPALRP